MGKYMTDSKWAGHFYPFLQKNGTLDGAALKRKEWDEKTCLSEHLCRRRDNTIHFFL